MIGVTETWLRPSDTQGLIDEITPVGFQIHHVPRRNKRGGVAVFVRNDIDGVLYQTDQRDTFEHITFKLSERQSSQLLVHIIYRPPNTSKSKFIEEFTCFMEAAALSPHENIVLDDLFIYLLFYVAFNSQGHIAMGSLWVEETSAYCTVNHRASASNYQLSNMKRLRGWRRKL